MNKREKLFENISGKKIFIWGARMTGIGVFRQLNNRGFDILGFVDSDPAFKNSNVCGLKVFSPIELQQYKFFSDNIALVIAASLKEEEIIYQLSEMKLSKYSVHSFFDEDAPYYTVDILGSCNLKCASCPHSIVDSNVPKGSMKLVTFKKVFDKIFKESPNISHLSLYSWGEPLLHPYVNEIIDYVHQKNVAVALSSNLSIKFGDRIKRIIQSKPDYLKISLSGFYPAAYNSTHSGGDINLVKKNLYLIKDYIEKYNSPTLVDINYHLYRDNSGENLKKMQQLADELGFILSKTFALVMPLERVISHLDGKKDIQTENLQNNLLVTIDEGIAVSSKIKLKDGNCPFRENQVNINSDLTVPVCCTVWERGKNVVVPNYLNSNLNEINDKKRNVDLCNKCISHNLPQYNMGFNKEGWSQIADKKAVNDLGDTI